jgi:magnesium transporter
MIAARDFAMLRKTFIEWHPADLAELLPDIGESDQVVLFKLLPRELAANTFAYLCAARQKHLLKGAGSGSVCSTHYFQRWQFWFPGCHLDRPGRWPLER